MISTQYPHNFTISCIISVWKHIILQKQKTSALAPKSPLFESHSVPCGCLATPLQHNILWINRVKRDHCLLRTTSQGCAPIILSALQHRCVTAWLQKIQRTIRKANMSCWSVWMLLCSCSTRGPFYSINKTNRTISCPHAAPEMLLNACFELDMHTYAYLNTLYATLVVHVMSCHMMTCFVKPSVISHQLSA